MKRRSLLAATLLAGTIIATGGGSASAGTPCDVPLDYPGPCIWDAGLRGGVSHRVFGDETGTVKYISDRRAAHLLYEGWLDPCEYEDSRGCVWDAKHMGNGKGDSFRAFKGGEVRYITHARAHRILFGE